MSAIAQAKETYDARFAHGRRYRYYWRWTWDSKKAPLVVIGLNPSTADEQRRDPTITRCVNYAEAWGYGSLWMLNLFAFRATDPREMKSANDPIGPNNDEWLVDLCGEAYHNRFGMILGAWGNHGTFQNRSRAVMRLLDGTARVKLHALRVTRAGQPQHPLYLPAALKPFELPRAEK